MPDLHPMIVHFPIALLCTGVLLDTADMLLHSERFRVTVLVLIVLGAVGMGAAIVSGSIAEGMVENIVGIERAVEFHEVLGYTAACVFGIYALLRVGVAYYFRGKALMLNALRVLALAALALLVYTGHTGGDLVHTYGAGTLRAQSVEIEGGRHE